jgi:hypothetical protein
LAALGPVVPDTAGIASYRLQLPSDPAWYGQCLQLQWAVFHAAAGPAGLVTSDALRLTVGAVP